MTPRPPPKLPLRWGCPFALAVPVGMVGIAVLAGDRGFRSDDWADYALLVAIVGAPFAVLTLARIRDWLAWLLGVVLTAAVWGYDMSRPYEGVNFLWGFILMIVAPIAISGLCLTTAGMRGRIPDWGSDDV